jgi:hypothetical protein
VYVNETKADAFHPDYVNYVGSKHDEFRWIRWRIKEAVLS